MTIITWLAVLLVAAAVLILFYWALFGMAGDQRGPGNENEGE